MRLLPTLLLPFSLCLPILAQEAPTDAVPKGELAKDAAPERVLAKVTGPSWPVHHRAESGAEVIVFQPQIESWLDFQKIHARAALAYKPASSSKFELGAMRFEALTDVDHERRSVLVHDFASITLTFPAISKGRSESLAKGVRKILPTDPVELSLDRVLSNFERELPSTSTLVKNPVPRIFHSEEPTLLVEFDGDPMIEPVEGAGCAFVLNTPSNLFRIAGKTWYLQFDRSWIQADSLDGPWKPVTRLPEAIRRLPDHPRWAHKSKVIPGKRIDKAPKVLISREPAELLMTFGKPDWTDIPGTKIQFVKNSESDLLREQGGDTIYTLLSGRWYRAKDWKGPWTFATDSLPKGFAKIPDDHIMGRVLASIPETEEARTATLESRIPRITKVKREKAKAEVLYLGEPDFEPIEGTRIGYATNTCQEVLQLGTAFYLCERGLWFRSDAPKGPWTVASDIPREFRTIPADHVMHRLSYVGVAGSDDKYVAAGFDVGYLGTYVDRGVLAHGTGRHFGHSRAWWTTCHLIWAHRPDWALQEDHPFYRSRTFGGGYYYDHFRNDFARALWARRTSSARKALRDPLSFWPRSAARAYRPGERGGRKIREASTGLPDGSSDLYVGRDGEIYRKTVKGGWEHRIKGRWESVHAPSRVAKESKARRRGSVSSGRYSDYGNSRSSPFPAGTIGGIMLIGQ